MYVVCVYIYIYMYVHVYVPCVCMCVCVCGEREWIICSFDAQFRTDLNSSLKLSMQDGILSNFQDKLNKKKRRKEGKEGGREGERGRRRRGRGGRKAVLVPSDRNRRGWWHSRCTTHPSLNFRHHLSSLMK